MKIYASLLPFVFLAALPSCNSSNEGTTATTHQNAITRQATLRWTGMLAADGCGFFLDIDGKEYKPANEEIIPDSFSEQDSSQVEVSYLMLEEPEEYSCGLLPARFPMNIEILEIKSL